MEDRYVVLEVKDNGVGISKSQLNKILDKLKNDTIIVPDQEMPHKGSGIALENVYKRIKIYYKGNASMNIESRIMKGTSITIRIPIDPLV